MLTLTMKSGGVIGVNSFAVLWECVWGASVRRYRTLCVVH